MTVPLRAARVRLVMVEGDRVALIRRRRSGYTYYVLPGGGVEPGETVEEAGRREAMEELGVEIGYDGLLAEETVHDQRFVYFRAHITGGEFGTGTWPDVAAYPPAERAAKGSYEPTWVKLADLDRHDVAAPVGDLVAGRPPVRMDRFDPAPERSATLAVTDVDATLRFYGRVLGLQAGVTPDRRGFLRLGEDTLHLSAAGSVGSANPGDAANPADATNPADEGERSRRTAPNAVTLRFVTGVRRDVLLTHLDAHGVAVEQPGLTDGRVLHIRDPDANLVQITVADGTA
jgi:8-oxo-dGTP diphosphatase